jgi:hypothetical protein
MELQTRVLMAKNLIGLKLAPRQVIELYKQSMKMALELCEIVVLRDIALSTSLLCNQVGDQLRI